MAQKALTIDTTSFDRQMKKLIKKMPSIANKALIEVADQVRTDANTKPPKTPHLWGELRSNVVILLVEDFHAVIWFTMPYAARWHEADPNEVTFSEAADGVGVKYLETKLLRYDKDYARLLADKIRKAVNSA